MIIEGKQTPSSKRDQSEQDPVRLFYMLIYSKEGNWVKIGME